MLDFWALTDRLVVGICPVIGLFEQAPTTDELELDIRAAKAWFIAISRPYDGLQLIT